MNEMAERLEFMRTELVASQQMNARLKKSSTDDSNNLRTAMKKILMLENELTEKVRHSEFMSKSLKQAKTEWNQLTQENALLKQRLAQLEQLANGGSKFAKFVAIKEENFKLADQNARLQKAHRIKSLAKTYATPQMTAPPIQCRSRAIRFLTLSSQHCLHRLTQLVPSAAERTNAAATMVRRSPEERHLYTWMLVRLAVVGSIV